MATERVETADEVADLILAAREHVPVERLYPCTNCGMAPMTREVARRKLEDWSNLRCRACGKSLGDAQCAVEIRHVDDAVPGDDLATFDKRTVGDHDAPVLAANRA